MRRPELAPILLMLSLTGCQAVDGYFCGSTTCTFSASEWSALQGLAGLPEAPPDDRSNRYVGNAAAIALGHQLYFDTRVSGNATQVDMLGRATAYARSAKGTPTNLSCASCHLPVRAGSDFTSIPGHVSVGAGWYDVNGQQTVNAAFYDLIYWNGRVDSLWSQIIAVAESPVSMGGNRVAISWLLFRKYRAAYESLFPEYPLPHTEALDALLTSGLEANGTCKLDNGQCPEGCRTLDTMQCVPRLPAQGKPGTTAGCQWGSATEPANDAFDCMAAADREAVTRAYVNFAKAIAAYEFTLVSRDSPFDRFVAEGPRSEALSTAAQRGARLFVGKASCIECHNTPFLSDNRFHNVGVPQVGAAVPTEADCPAGGRCNCVAGTNCLPWGGYDGLKKYQANGFRRDSKWSDDPTDDSRQAWRELELTPELIGTWRTPSLRDVALTAPYMHDGLYATLEDVVAHYNRGGLRAGVPGQVSVRIRPLGLTDGEQADLVAFLHTLTGAALPTELTAAPTLP